MSEKNLSNIGSDIPGNLAPKDANAKREEKSLYGDDKRAHQKKQAIHYLFIAALFIIDDKILDFSDVIEGWHFGEGASISATAIRDATKLHNALLLNGFYETDAFPGLAGEIRVTAYFQDKYFEFTRETDGNWSYVCESEGETEEELENLTLTQALGIVATMSPEQP